MSLISEVCLPILLWTREHWITRHAKSSIHTNITNPTDRTPPSGPPMNFNRQMELTHLSPSDENTPYIPPSKFYEIEISKTKREESNVSMTTEANTKKKPILLSLASLRFSLLPNHSPPSLCFSPPIHTYALYRPQIRMLMKIVGFVIDFFCCGKRLVCRPHFGVDF